MNIAFLIAGLSCTLFVVHAVLCEYETARRRRLVAGGLRLFVDNALDRMLALLAHRWSYVSKYVITLSWYYSLHAFLIMVLKMLAGVYGAVEAIVLRNRDRAKAIRRDHRQSQNHLSLIAEHREQTALTAREKTRRKEKALSGK